MRYFKICSQRHVNIYLLMVILFPLLSGDYWSQPVDHSNVVLRVTPAHVTSLSDQLLVPLSVESAFAPGRVTAIHDGSTPRADRNGHGRPGASGTIIIEGIGLAGASAIKFEGEGVSGSIMPLPSDDLNPQILIDIHIDASAPLGPRRFTLTTPNGEVSSGDVVFIVEEPKITAIGDREGAPNSRGSVGISGIGLDGATDVTFSGTGVTGEVIRQRPLPLLNPSVAVELDIAASAPLGERTFTVVTPRGSVDSGDVTFRVVNPRITALIEGSSLGVEFKPSGEGVPGTRGTAFVIGIGLSGVSSIRFSGTGVRADLTPEATMDDGRWRMVCGPSSVVRRLRSSHPLNRLTPPDEKFSAVASEDRSGLLNPTIYIFMTITPNAPLGARTFTLTIPRGSGMISSADFGVTFNVVRPRVISIWENEGVPGACGRVTIHGVGLKDTTKILFDGPPGLSGVIKTAAGDLLNPPAQAQLSIRREATLGSYSFTLRTPHGIVRSGDVVFTVTTPRITKMNTAGGFFTILDVPDAAAPGTSGMAAIQGIGLIGVEAVTFSGVGVTATVVPPPPDLFVDWLNPGVLLNMTVSQSAPLGERSIELTLTGAGASCQ